MKKVRLETREGGLVVEVEIPPFKMFPEVISWGSRTFAHLMQDHQAITTPVYREVTAYVVPL